RYPKIVHRACHFKAVPRMSGSRNKPLKNHLIGVARGALALFGRAHGPGQQWATKDIAGDPWRGRRQLVDPEGDEMRLGAKAVADVEHAVALLLRQLGPVVVVIIALRDNAARQVRHDLA